MRLKYRDRDTRKCVGMEGEREIVKERDRER